MKIERPANTDPPRKKPKPAYVLDGLNPLPLPLGYRSMVAGTGYDPATLGYEPNEIPISTTPHRKDNHLHIKKQNRDEKQGR